MQYKIVACILLMLPVFSFVLAAPVPVLEVREARTDAGEPNEDMIIISRTLAAPEQSPHEPTYSDSGSDSGSSASDTELQASTSQSSSTTDHANVWSVPGEPSNAKKVVWAPTTKVHFYNTDDPPGVRPEGLPPLTAPTTQSSRFVSFFKKIFGQLGKLRFWRRFQRTIDTGA